MKPLKSAQSCGDWSSHVLVLILTVTNKRVLHGGWTWKDLNLLPWHWIWCQVPSTGNAVPPNNYIPQYFWNPRSSMLLLTPSKLEDAISFQKEEKNIRSASIIHFEAGFWMQSTANWTTSKQTQTWARRLFFYFTQSRHLSSTPGQQCECDLPINRSACISQHGPIVQRADSGKDGMLHHRPQAAGGSHRDPGVGVSWGGPYAAGTGPLSPPTVVDVALDYGSTVQ